MTPAVIIPIRMKIQIKNAKIQIEIKIQIPSVSKSILNTVIESDNNSVILDPLDPLNPLNILWFIYKCHENMKMNSAK